MISLSTVWLIAVLAFAGVFFSVDILLSRILDALEGDAS